MKKLYARIVYTIVKFQKLLLIHKECNYCHQIKELSVEYGTGTKKGEDAFKILSDKIKHDAKGKTYDCVVGVSGGVDSSYILHLMKKFGHKPLAVHYDNTWNSSIATQNIRKLTKALDIDLFTYVVDNKEIDDIYRVFISVSAGDRCANRHCTYENTV